jgi:hypothetical protein
MFFNVAVVVSPPLRALFVLDRYIRSPGVGWNFGPMGRSECL